MLVVIHFCSKDWAQTVKNLQWFKELDGSLPFHVVLSHDDETHPDHVRQVTEAARAVFQKVSDFWYPAPLKKSWPAAPNWAWQNSARGIAALYNEPWLWLEYDAVAIRKGWLNDIAEDYRKCGKPFAGHLVEGMGHLNGVMVYPANVAQYSIAAFQTEESAWDVVLGSDLAMHEGGIMASSHPAHTLFQHCWCVGEDGKCWNGSGSLPTFRNTQDVVKMVDLTMALFHRNKDGTLIEQLRAYYKDPSTAMVPKHIDEAKAVELPKPVKTSDAYKGRCEIMIVTYFKDEPWLRYCLRAIRKYCKGFAGVTLVIPDRDAQAFQEVAREHMNANCGMALRIKMFKETPGKGMLAHMVMMAGAEKLCPKDTDHVLHLDADCIFKEAVTPDEYIVDNKPVYVVRTWKSLYSEDGKSVSDCIQWHQPTEAQLGFAPLVYSMCRHPTCFPIGFYEPYRKHVESVHNKDFTEYMLEGKNSHPATRMDFTAQGAFAYQTMRDRFRWIMIYDEQPPRDKLKAYWSHGGITEEIKKEIESFLI